MYRFQTINLVLFFCFFTTYTFGQPNFVSPNYRVNMSLIKQSHPRVLVGDFGVIRERIKTNKVMQDWLLNLGQETTMDALALRYCLTKDSNLIQESVDSALSLKLDEKIKKGPHHYGKSIMFLGCTFDWLHDDLNVVQRNQLLVLLKKGLNAYLVDPDKTNFHNMNHCLNAGAIVAALSIADEEPDLSKKVLEIAINTINLTWYKPDGVTPEGPHYMNWSSLVMISGLASLDIAFGKGFGLSEEPGLNGYADFMMHITIPEKGIAVKYSDCYTNGTYYNLSQLFWIANKFNRPDISQFALENDPFTASGENPDYSGKIHQLLWYAPEKFKNNPKQYLAIPFDKQFKSAELAVMRSSWNDNETIFAGIKGTDNYHQANFYHRHTNTGTFFLSALGQQWAVDLGLEDYNLPDYNEQPRHYYKLRAEGHNCNIINPASGIDQLGWENCPIINSGNTDKSSFAIVDMTPDYLHLAKSAKRGLQLFDHRRKVLLQDEISSVDGKPIDSYWFMQTEAGIQISKDGRSAILYRSNERLLVYLATAPKDAKFTIMNTEPLIYTKSVSHKQDWTFGAKKLLIHTNTEINLKLAIVFVPLHKGDSAIINPIPFTELDSWKKTDLPEAELSNLLLDDKPFLKFDKRQFTYNIDLNTSSIPKINAIAGQSKSVVKVVKDLFNLQKIIITVSANGFETSSYFLYFRHNPFRIIGNSRHEYSSWDESFSNHRIIAPKLKAGESIDYELNQKTAIKTISIGFTNQNTKSYQFELWTSDDNKNWILVYNGTSKMLKKVTMPMPQQFLININATKYIRIKNPLGSPSFSFDILSFHNNEDEASSYLKNTYKEILSSIEMELPKDSFEKGKHYSLKLHGFSNYGNEITLDDAEIYFQAVSNECFTVSEKGELNTLTNGVGNIKIVIKKGDFVFHKSFSIKIS